MVPGTITVGTQPPGESPWYVGESPSTGQGLESAVAYAAAQALGYGPDRVRWTVVDRAEAVAGAAKDFDMSLDQLTAPDAGSATADYSTGYYAVTDTVVMRQDDTALPTSLAALAGVPLGVVSGISMMEANRTPDSGWLSGTDPVPFAHSQSAFAELANGSVDGIVLPTPDALAAVIARPGLRLAGQLPTDPTEAPQQFKVLLPKGSALTGCVSAAIDRLRVEGTLAQLARTWVDAQVPVLR